MYRKVADRNHKGAKVRLLAKRKRSRRKLLFNEKEIDNLMQHYKFPGEVFAVGSIETDKINT
jgi:hypothetical protein